MDSILDGTRQRINIHAFDPFAADEADVRAVIASDEYREWLAADCMDARRDEALAAERLRAEHRERFGNSFGGYDS